MTKYISVNQSSYALKTASELFPETFETAIKTERKFEIICQFDFVFDAYYMKDGV